MQRTRGWPGNVTDLREDVPRKLFSHGGFRSQGIQVVFLRSNNHCVEAKAWGRTCEERDVSGPVAISCRVDDLTKEASKNASLYSVSALLALAWPVIFARASQAVIGFSDTLMTGRLGEEELAATTMGATNTFALIILPMGIVFIVQSFAAQLKGQGNAGMSRPYAWYGLIVAAASMVVAMLAIPLITPVLSLFDYEPPVRALMDDYLTIRLMAIGAVVGTEAIGSWYGGLGNTRLHMVIGILVMNVNVALNWVLIYGNLGAPALGVEGAAWASAIASWLGFVAIAWVFHRRLFLEISWTPVRLRMKELYRVLRFGVPNGLNWLVEFAAWVLFLNFVVADLGTTVLAAMMVVINLNSVSFMPAFGLASAGAILVGQAIGEGNKGLVPTIAKRTAAVMVAWQGGVGLSYLLFPAVLIGWFIKPGESSTGGEGAALLAIGTVLLAISAAWQLFDAVAMTLAEALRAAGDTAWVLWARSVIAWGLFMPISILVVRVLPGGPVAAICCVVAYLALLAGCLWYRFQSGAWRKISLTGQEISWL